MSNLKDSANLTLGGSSINIANTFKYTLYSILLHRNVYPDDDYESEQCEGMNLMVHSSPEVKQYVEELSEQIDRWAKLNQLERIAVAITSADNLEVIERWTFFVDSKSDTADREGAAPTDVKKRQQEFQQQMRKLMVQIVNINAILPILDTNTVAFDVYVYTTKGAENNPKWRDTEAAPMILGDTEHARLGNIDTSDSTFKPLVSFKRPTF